MFVLEREIVDKLYAPWRHKYVKRTNKHDSDHCVFCTHVTEKDKDEENFVLKRYKHCFLILNLYPYNGGHLLVVPYEHKGDLISLEPKVRHEIIDVATEATEILGSTQKPYGFNLGLNLGKAGGGGLPDHLHLHVLPRWKSDTNFLATLGHTQVISVDLEQTYKKLKELF
jgi:ATP adenylyltransferase